MMSKTIHIGNVIHHATVFNFQKHHDTIMNTDALLGAVEQLFMLLHGRHIDYLLVGGIAMLQYVQGRNTEDIDLIIASASLQKLPEITLTSQDDHFARGTFNALQIDFRLTHNPVFSLVQQHYSG